MSKALATITPNLEQAPGWMALSQEKRDWLTTKTANITNYKRLEGLAALGGSIELEEVERALKSEPMSFTTYVRTVYGSSARTAFRRLADLKELRKHWNDSVIKGIASNGAMWLRGAAGSGMKDVINVARELPAPRTNEPAVIEGFVSRKVREKLREQRRHRRTGAVLRLDEEGSVRAALNALLRYMRAARLHNAAGKKKWLIRVVGMAMENQVIPGPITVNRLDVPDGYILRRGRPRKMHARKAA